MFLQQRQTPYLNILINLRVKEDEHGKGKNPEDDKPCNVVVVERVVVVHPQPGDGDDGLGDVGKVVDGHPSDGALKELGQVEEHGEEEHGHEVLKHATNARVLVVHGLEEGKNGVRK
jgi:hypothetical protein